MSPRPPGFLRPDHTIDVVMMVCTAGHVDHGKTSLVKLLTGCNTDRLQSEQERGLTIELGFAPCLLSGETGIGIVDVPGHEKFVRNMVAGVPGISLAVLVVAADDGIMPQTLEHYQILELLGVRHGIIALTKIDLVAAERIAEVEDQLRRQFAGTFLQNAPILPVSSVSLEGVSAFHQTLVASVRELVQRPTHGLFRMPVIHAFVREGFGHVITGIPIDGEITTRSEVELVPGGQRGRIRGIQRFMRDTDTGRCGQCLALNIPDLGKTPARRGQVLTVPGVLRPAATLHLRMRVVRGVDPPLRNAEEIKFHTGTAEEAGKLYLLEQKIASSEQTVLATAVLARQVAAGPHDRFIIRRTSPALTVAGGEILSCEGPPRRPHRRVALASLQAYLDRLDGADPQSTDGVDRRLEHLLGDALPCGASSDALCAATLLRPDRIRESLARLVAAGTVLEIGRDEFVHRQTLEAACKTIEKRIQEETDRGGNLTIAIRSLRPNDWSQGLFNAVLDRLERDAIIARHGDKVVHQAAVSNLSAVDQDLIKRLLEIYQDAGFSSPRPDQLPDRLGATSAEIERLLDYLHQERRLVRLNKKVVLSRDALRQAQRMVVKLIRENGVLNSADLKYHLGSSRKYALAILDYLDLVRVTVRSGNDRKLAADYEKRLI